MNSYSYIRTCKKGARLSISDDQTTELAELFRLLGEVNRLKIVLACLEEPRCVSDIAAEAQLSPSLVSHHLRMLRAERRGKQVFYAPADQHVRCVLSDMVAHIAEPVPESADGGPT